jgi:hypothetical protein
VPRIFVATRDGLHTVDGGAPAFAGRHVTALAPEGDGIWAVLDGSEVWRRADAGPWNHVGDLEGPRATCVVATDHDVFVGSSEARLFRLADRELEPVLSFDDAEGRAAWYTPWGGPPDTRSFSEWDEAIYVNVHVGGILRTEDRGAAWHPTIDIEADVHQVATAEGGIVLAACAGGLGVSVDRGGTWTFRTEGLAARYSRAVTVCGDAILVSTSNGPRGGRGGVYRADLATGGFERCRAGLPEWFDDNIDSHCLDALPDRDVVAFGTSDGRLFASEDRGSTWNQAGSELPPVTGVLVLP